MYFNPTFCPVRSERDRQRNVEVIEWDQGRENKMWGEWQRTGLGLLPSRPLPLLFSPLHQNLSSLKTECAGHLAVPFLPPSFFKDFSLLEGNFRHMAGISWLLSMTAPWEPGNGGSAFLPFGEGGTKALTEEFKRAHTRPSSVDSPRTILDAYTGMDKFGHIPFLPFFLRVSPLKILVIFWMCLFCLIIAFIYWLCKMCLTSTWRFI